MGCFNITCFASNQTIAPGDACRVLPVLQQSDYSAVALSRGEEQAQAYGAANSVCYADSFWTPLGGFIAATYDDYGRVKLELDPLMRAQVVHLLETLVQRGWVSAQGDNSHHDLPFDLPAFMADKAPGVAALFAKGDAFMNVVSLADTPWGGGALDAELADCWAHVWEVAYKHRVFASTHQGVPRAVQFAVLHEQAYQALVAQVAEATDWDGNSYEPRAHLAQQLAQARVRIEERKQKLRAKDPARFSPEQEGDRVTVGFWLADALRDVLSRANGQGGHLAGVAGAVTLEWGIASAQDKLADADLIEQMVPLLQGQYALGALNHLNLRIAPMATAGQDYDNELGRAYARFIDKVSRQVTRARKERDGPLLPYTLVADSQEQVDTLADLVGEWDGYVDDVQVTVVDGKLQVGLSCTLGLDDFREALEESDRPGMAATLAAVPADPAPGASAQAQQG